MSARLASALVLTILGLGASPGVLAQPFDFTITGDTQAGPGDVVRYDYVVDDADGLVTLDLQLRYDAAVLALRAVTPNALLTSDPPCALYCFDWNDIAGQVNVSASALFGLTGAPFTIVNLEFDVLVGAAPGDYLFDYGAFDLSMVDPNDPTGPPIPVAPGDISASGRLLTVTAAPVPVSPPLLLLAPGLYLLVAGRRRRATAANGIDQSGSGFGGSAM